MSELKMLSELYSGKVLSEMSGKHKLAYKYSLAAIFCNLIVGANHTEGQKVNLKNAGAIRTLDRKKTDFDAIVRDFRPQVESSLRKNSFYTHTAPDTLNKIIQFARSRLSKLENNSLFQVSEISSLLNIKEYFGIKHVQEHQWVDLDLHSGLIFTIPEVIIFQDLKAIWNEYVSVRNYLITEKDKNVTEEDFFNFYQKNDIRTKQYLKHSLMRNLHLLAVIFVESYLYNVYCTLSNVEFEGKDQCKKMLNLSKIEDEVIVKTVLYKCFPSIKVKSDLLFKEYRKALSVRNRYVHASAFPAASGGSAELQHILNISDGLLVSTLQNCIDFVHSVDSELPEQLSHLFWWYDGEIVFSEFPLLKLTNPKASYNRRTYKVDD